MFSIFAALLFGSWVAGLIVAVILAAIATHSGKLRLVPDQITWRLPERLQRRLPPQSISPFARYRR